MCIYGVKRVLEMNLVCFINGRKEISDLMTHSTSFIYCNMASDIW